MDLADILRMLAGDRMAAPNRAAASSNEELVAGLKRRGTITSDLVYRAMLACPRGLFVPANLQRQAYMDAPIRVEDLGFNISAPHIHATALEALELKPGDSFLDVGSGTGLVAAAAAYMVGKTGCVTSVDIRPRATAMCVQNVQELKAKNAEYESIACNVSFEVYNIFIPCPAFQGRYDKMYIGAACPADRLAGLVKILRPGGRMLVPVSSELLLVHKREDGGVRQQSLSSVSFSELEVPSDSEVVMALMEREGQATVKVPESTLAQDATAAAVAAAASASNGSAGAVDRECCAPEQRQQGEAGGKGAQHGHAAAAKEAENSSQGEAEDGVHAVNGGDMKRHKSDPSYCTPSYLGATSASALGPPDCHVLVGGEQPQTRLPAHKALLGVRCDHLRALFGSGMRDAGHADIAAPESFSKVAVEAMLQWVYTDELQVAEADEHAIEKVAEVLHVACYYGCSRLVALCEAALARSLCASTTRPRRGNREHVRQQHKDGHKQGQQGQQQGQQGQQQGQQGQQQGQQQGGQGQQGQGEQQQGNGHPGSPSRASPSSHPLSGGSCSSTPRTSPNGGAKAAAAAAAAVAAGCELAPQLLTLAADNGLQQLRDVALCFIADHFDAVAAGEAWQQLSREAVEQVTRHLAARHARLLAIVNEVAQSHGCLEEDGARARWHGRPGLPEREEEEEEEEEDGVEESDGEDGVV